MTRVSIKRSRLTAALRIAAIQSEIDAQLAKDAGDVRLSMALHQQALADAGMADVLEELTYVTLTD